MKGLKSSQKLTCGAYTTFHDCTPYTDDSNDCEVLTGRNTTQDSLPAKRKLQPNYKQVYNNCGAGRDQFMSSLVIKIITYSVSKISC
jgi:hypothetical protein